MTQENKPFKVRVSQCSVGQYDLLSSDKTLSFFMGIYTEDNRVCEENGIKAILHYSGDSDELPDFEDAIDNLGEVFQRCFDYSKKVYGTTPYTEQCLVFAKIYHEHFDDLNFNMKIKRDADILKDIGRLQKRMTEKVLADIDYEIETTVKEQIKSDQEWVEFYSKKNIELKEDSESYSKNLEHIEEYRDKIDVLKKYLTTLEPH